MSDTTDSSIHVPRVLGDLLDVDAPTASADGLGTLVKPAAADAEWTKIAASAAIPDAAAAPTQAEFNAVLAALRAHAIILP